jgi:hypothetical protein
MIPITTKMSLSVWSLSFPSTGTISADCFQIYIDAKNPSGSISSNQARVIIRKLVAGLHAAGLKKGDCVCLHSFNDVRINLVFFSHFLTLITDILFHVSPWNYRCWRCVYRCQSRLYEARARPSCQDLKSDILDL